MDFSHSVQVERIEISGFEIIGPNKEITYEEAMENRLIKNKMFRGRGIVAWSGKNRFGKWCVNECFNVQCKETTSTFTTITSTTVPTAASAWTRATTSPSRTTSSTPTPGGAAAPSPPWSSLRPQTLTTSRSKKRQNYFYT